MVTVPPGVPDSAYTAARSAGLQGGSVHTDSAAGLSMHLMSADLAVAGGLDWRAWGIQFIGQ